MNEGERVLWKRVEKLETLLERQENLIGRSIGVLEKHNTCLKILSVALFFLYVLTCFR